MLYIFFDYYLESPECYLKNYYYISSFSYFSYYYYISCCTDFGSTKEVLFFSRISLLLKRVFYSCNSLFELEFDLLLQESLSY